MHVQIQEAIHRLEMGGGSRVLKYALVVIVALTAAILYDLTSFRNLSTIEGMDAAQLARNLAEGKGYTTLFVRPFSIRLVEQHRADHDPRLKGAHPDLANPPLYPLLLAIGLKLMPWGYPEITTKTTFSIYRPDLWIAMCNQVLLLLAAVLVFRLAKRFFDEPVAWVSAIVFLGSEVFWKFSVSGLSTVLLVLLFLVLTTVLARLEPLSREADANPVTLYSLAAFAGALMGAGCLTRYAFGWLMVALVVWLMQAGGRHRGWLVSAAVAAFLVVVGPWVIRNIVASGTPFGTAGFALVQNTSQFSEHQLERSLAPSFAQLSTEDFTRKFVVNAREMVQSDLPRLGGSWVAAFFWVGLLVPFRNPTLSRLRVWLVLCLLTLFMVQALGRTALTAESPEVNSENLLVVVAPLGFIFGVGLLFILVEQLGLNAAAARFWIIGFVAVIACVPVLASWLPPHPSPLAYPPYYPPWIEAKCRLTAAGQWLMTDVPWATAWYGRRQSVWLPLKYKSNPADKIQDDFYAINRRKPVRALYLTGRSLKTMEVASVVRWAQGGASEEDWDNFVLGTYLRQEVPTGFPLRSAPAGLAPEIFLTDSERAGQKTIQQE